MQLRAICASCMHLCLDKKAAKSKKHNLFTSLVNQIAAYLTSCFIQNQLICDVFKKDEFDIPASERFGAAACVGGSSRGGRRRAICENRTQLRALIHSQTDS